MSDWVSAARAQGLCEQRVWRGPRADQMCLNRARWRRRRRTPAFDGGVRVCGVHARAYTGASLVEIGSPGWAFA